MSNIPNPYGQLPGYVQGTYDDSQIRQAIAIYELFLNSGGTIPVSVGATGSPVIRTPAYTTTTTSGSTPSGAISVAIANIGTATGTVQGSNLPIGTSVDWDAPIGSTLSSISYNATGTTFSISTLT